VSLIGTAASALTSQTKSLDTIANNIANLDTAGYEATSTTFADTLTQVFAQSPAQTDLADRQTPIGLWLGTGVYAQPTQRSFAQGAYKQTANPLDMAIDGDGFFTVRMADGNTGYTRAGDFVASAAGDGRFYLATPAGQYVLGTGGQPIDLTDMRLASVAVAPDGTVTADSLAGKPTVVGKLSLAYVAHPTSALRSMGADVYELAPGYVATTNVAGANPSLFGLVQNKMLEMSNVNLTDAMTNMIQTQQNFDMSAQAVDIADKMMGLVNSLGQ
jgi:flagellar basal-body rod protein FlgG